MPIEMPKGLPFSVDTWSQSSKSNKRHHFLTHAHKDHSASITSHSYFPIYSTLLTKTLLLQQYPHLDVSLFLDIEVGQSLIIDDPDGTFTVTAFDANHCPGAVMFLFEGKFGNILHTGDCRLTLECLLNLPDKYVGRKGKLPRCPLDCVFLDCTFGNFSRSMPSKHSAIQQVINCIWKHPYASTVYLTCDLLGQEDILVQVSQTFGAKIYVDKAKNQECFKNLVVTVPGILCEDPSSRFHLSDGSPGLYERAKAKLVEAKATLQPEPLIVRPSAMWYACEEGSSDMENARKKRMNEAVMDQFGVWHVCYSIHSSKEELEWALELLAPKWVVSTTPSCRAMELGYVKKHCFNSKAGLNNSMWKLLDMTTETSDDVDPLIKSVSCYPVLESTSQHCVQTKSPIKQCPDAKEELSPPGKCLPATLFGTARPGVQTKSPVKRLTDAKAVNGLSHPDQRSPITLFGRARLGLQDDFSQRVRDILPFDVPSQTISDDAREEFLDDVEDASEAKCERSLERKEDLLQVNKHPDCSQRVRNILPFDVPLQTVSDDAREEFLDDVEDASEAKCEKSPERKEDLQQVNKYQYSEVQENTRVRKSASYLNIGSSGLSENVSKPYWSMKLPVPRPLPSLVDLMNSIKRTKRAIDY